MRGRFDKANFTQSQRVEADRVLGLIFPPFIVRNIAQCLEGIIVARRKASIDKLLRGTLRLGGTKVCTGLTFFTRLFPTLQVSLINYRIIGRQMLVLFA